jgi:hypothetical protein
MTTTTLTAVSPDAVPIEALLARATVDRSFRAALIDAPEACLKEHGIAVPGGVRVQVFDPPPGTTCLVLLSAPAEGELSDSDLEAVSAGFTPTLLPTIVMTVALQPALSFIMSKRSADPV